PHADPPAPFAAPPIHSSSTAGQLGLRPASSSIPLFHPLPPPSSHLLSRRRTMPLGPLSPPSSSGGGARRSGLGLCHRWRGSFPPSSSRIVLQPQHTDSNTASCISQFLSFLIRVSYFEICRSHMR
uniref:Uncharacterized protein n=1 Tax=Triticum urartu TaxID=4572 RepID=A0A8R7U1F5_TRIUA